MKSEPSNPYNSRPAKRASINCPTVRERIQRGYSAEFNIKETFRQFCFHSLYVKPEIIRSMQAFKSECEKLLSHHIFELRSKTSAQVHPVSIFKGIQENALDILQYYIFGTWTDNLKAILKSNLSGVGKGWFNLQESNKNAFEFGKVKKILTILRFIMQDTLYDIIRRDYLELSAWFQKFLVKDVHVVDIRTVHATQRKAFKFSLDVVPATTLDSFQYSEDPDANYLVLQKIIANPIKTLGKVQDLTPYIMDKLFSQQNPGFSNLALPVLIIDERGEQSSHEWLAEVAGDILRGFQKCTQPLKDYLRTLSKFLPVLQYSQSALLAEAQAGNYDIAEVKARISKYREQSQAIREEIPLHTQIGIYRVSCESLVQYLENLISNQIRVLHQYAIDVLKKVQAKVQKSIDKIQSQLRRVPQTCDELAEYKRYVERLPDEFDMFKSTQKKYFELFDEIELMGYRFPPDQYSARWQIYGAFKHALDFVHGRNKQMGAIESRFKTQVFESIQDFQQIINAIQSTICEFQQQSDLHQ